MNILSKLTRIGNTGYEPRFKVEINGLDRIIDIAISGSASEYRLGKIALEQPPVSEISMALKPSRKEVTGLAIEPSTKKLIEKTTGYVPSYTLEAAIESGGSRRELPVGIDFLKEAGFNVTAGNKEKSYLYISGGNFPKGAMAKYFGTSQTATLTYSQSAAGLTAEEVGKTIRSFTQALECVVKGIYNAARKSPPDKTLSLKLGEKISRITGQKIPVVATRGYSAEGGTNSEKSDIEAFEQALQPAKSDMRLEDIGGYQNIKTEVRTFRDGIKYSELAKKHGYKPPKGILFFGPPGTGKTMFANAIGGEADALFFTIQATAMIDKYVGESPKMLTHSIKSAEKAAEESKRPSILFIDEVDAILLERNSHEGSGSVTSQLVTVFNYYMDGPGTKEIPNVYIVAATNRLEALDKAALRPPRFTQIEVPLPDLEARTAIFNAVKSKVEGDAGAALFKLQIDYRNLAEKTEGFSGAEIAALLNEVRKSAFETAKEKGLEIPVPTAQHELEAAIESMRQKGTGKMPRHMGLVKR